MPPKVRGELSEMEAPPLAAVAAASRASRAKLLDLNPHLLRGLTPPRAAPRARPTVPTPAVLAYARGGWDEGEGGVRPERRGACGRHDRWGGRGEALLVGRC